MLARSSHVVLLGARTNMQHIYLRSADYVTPGESLDPDAVMDVADLNEIRRLAGLLPLPVTEDKKADGTYSNPSGTMSTVGSSGTNSEKLKKERELGIKPGDPEWFALWFKDKR